MRRKKEGELQITWWKPCVLRSCQCVQEIPSCYSKTSIVIKRRQTSFISGVNKTYVRVCSETCNEGRHLDRVGSDNYAQSENCHSRAVKTQCWVVLPGRDQSPRKPYFPISYFVRKPHGDVVATERAVKSALFGGITSVLYHPSLWNRVRKISETSYRSRNRTAFFDTVSCLYVQVQMRKFEQNSHLSFAKFWDPRDTRNDLEKSFLISQCDVSRVRLHSSFALRVPPKLSLLLSQILHLFVTIDQELALLFSCRWSGFGPNKIWSNQSKILTAHNIFSAILLCPYKDTAFAIMTAKHENIESVWYRCSPAMILGEAPIWKDNTLHWVDCFASPPVIHRLRTHEAGIGGEEVVPITSSILSTTRFENSITVMCFRKGRGNDYICAYDAGIGFVDVVEGNYGKLQGVKEIIPPSERYLRRFNDGGVDAKGRFWFGEVDKKAASYGAGESSTARIVSGYCQEASQISERLLSIRNSSNHLEAPYLSIIEQFKTNQSSGNLSLICMSYREDSWRPCSYWSTMALWSRWVAPRNGEWHYLRKWNCMEPWQQN